MKKLHPLNPVLPPELVEAVYVQALQQAELAYRKGDTPFLQLAEAVALSFGTEPEYEPFPANHPGTIVRRWK